MASYQYDVVKKAAANPSTQQTNASLVAAPTGGTIRVISIYCVAPTAIDVDFKDGSGGSVKWSVYAAADGGVDAARTAPDYLFDLTANTALVYDTSAATEVFLSVSYVVI